MPFQIDDYRFALTGPVLTGIGLSAWPKPLRIAAFDLDGTLIKPLAGRSTFDADPDNWQWYHSSVPETLGKIAHRGYVVVIITNQGGHSIKKIEDEGVTHNLVQKFVRIAKKLASHGVVPQLVACVGRSSGPAGEARKPAGKMWDHLLEEVFKERPVHSFFVGDAAGREGDHSDCDREFSRRLGMPFYLPEEVFHQTGEDVRRPVSDQELTILVGYPGAGKTTYARGHLADSEIVAQDTMRSGKRTSRKLPEVIADVSRALKAGKSVVVDRLNLTKSERSQFIALAERSGASARCLVFDVEMDKAYQKNVQRNLEDDSFPKIPKIAYYKMRKNYEPPDESEGCRVEHVDPHQETVKRLTLDDILETERTQWVDQVIQGATPGDKPVLCRDQVIEEPDQDWVDRVVGLLDRTKERRKWLDEVIDE
jgi:bifunctional polynucleotide phosphatase/kinase